MHVTRTQGPPLEAEDRNRLLEHVARLGQRELWRRIPLSWTAIARAIGGLSVTRGTSAQIRLWRAEQGDTSVSAARQTAS